MDIRHKLYHGYCWPGHGFVTVKVKSSPFTQCSLLFSRFRFKTDTTLAKLIKIWSTVSLLSFGISALSGGLVHHYYPHTSAYPNTPTGWHVFWWMGFFLFFSFIQIPLNFELWEIIKFSVISQSIDLISWLKLAN